MKRNKGIETIQKLLVILIFSFGLYSCSDSLSGFGAETTNGAVTVSLIGDNNYDSCIVQIIPNDYNPLIMDTSANYNNGYTTDEGKVTFGAIKSGVYSIYSKNFITGKKSIVTDFKLDGDTIITLEMSNPGDIHVTFKNSESVLDTVNGCLLILGYPEYLKLDNNIENVDSGYSVVFDSIPAAIIRTLSYSSSEDGNVIQNISDSVPVNSDDTTFVDAILYYTFVNSSNSNFIPDSISNFIYGSNGIRWLSNGHDLLKIDDDTVLTLNSSNSNIAGGNINTIHEGVNGAIWIGTEEGISVSSDYRSWTTLNYENSNIEIKNVTSIIDIDSTIFVGTLGNGLFSFDGTQWKHYSCKINGLPSDSITALIIDSDGDLLGGTTFGIFSLIDNVIYTYLNAHSYFRSLHITALAQDSAEGFWIGTAAGEILHLTESLWFNYSMAVNNLSDNSITSIICDNKGDIWAGSAEGRFYRYPKNGEVNGWLVYLGQEGILPGVSISSIDIAQNGVIYCGTLGYGIFILGASSVEVTSNWEHCY